MEVQLIYDCSFEGFLTAVFQVYEEHLTAVRILKPDQVLGDFFAKNQRVYTQTEQAKRVWKGLAPYPGFRTQLYRSFLSEKPGVENIMLDAIRYVLKTGNSKDYGHKSVLQLVKFTKEVGREKHRMEAFVRFKRTRDDTYAAIIEPDFDVLPLIATHFKNRYADQVFVIYDGKRHYGIYYNLESISYVEFEDFSTSKLEVIQHQEEIAYDHMWQDYFISTGIERRKNTKLHLRHVPHRYWKYLNEKSNRNKQN